MKRKAKIYYISLDDFWRKEEKLAWLNDNPIEKIAFEKIEPDAKNNWINQTDNDWDSLLPLIDKDVKAGKSEEAIFKLFSRGVETGRDEWVYDLSKDELETKAKFLINSYNNSLKQNKIDYEIKWTSSLEAYFKGKHKAEYSDSYIFNSLYRPYFKMLHYADRLFNHRLTQNHFEMFGKELNNPNQIISFCGVGSNKPFHNLATDLLVGLDTLEKTQCLPLYVYEENQKHENITDWALNQFQTHYKESNGAQITKQDIFYYVYAVLHAPQYRKKYEQNLKREFPRLPFYADFRQWRDWGAALMDLHINYETQEPFALERNDLDLSAKRRIVQNSMFDQIGNEKIDDFVAKPQTKLRADKENGAIVIDSITTLSGVPSQAWEYKLGNRSAIEWILDQYKEKTPQDATIRERFNHYKFTDYKEQVIDLLMRVTNVSVKTMEIVNQMPNAE